MAVVYRVAGDVHTQPPQQGLILGGDDVGAVSLAALQLAQLIQGQLHRVVGGGADGQGDQHVGQIHGCEAHSTSIISAEDEALLRRLGVNITCDPVYDSPMLTQ